MSVELQFIIYILLITSIILIYKTIIEQKISKKYKLYLFLNDIFEKSIINEKNELLKYSLNARLIVKNNDAYALTDSGILYIKDYIQNNLIFVLTAYSTITTILTILISFNK